MNLYEKALLFQNKWIQPYIRLFLLLIDGITYIASIALIGGVIYEHGFTITLDVQAQINDLYRVVWIVFLVHATAHILLEYKDTRKNYRRLMWLMSVLLYLTLVPVIFFEPEPGIVHYIWVFLGSKTYHLFLLLILSFLQISSGIIRLLGRRTNPSLILAFSFFTIILIGTGLLMLPRATFYGISWIDALFTATSAVCVTGLVSVDVPSTFTTEGLVIIILLIQIGGLGVMTLTSFFALFFMGNTTLYNQVVVKDMVSSNSLGSLFSTLLYILGFTLVIEAIGMIILFLNIHNTLDMNLREEIAFSAFHAVSAFCNAGFSTMPGNLGNPLLMQGHNTLYITVSVLIILGGIGFPILVNFKDIVMYHLKRIILFLRTWKKVSGRRIHLYNLNTRIVLLMTVILLAGGTLTIAIFEWNHAFSGMPVVNKIVQSFFNATSPRTAGFSSVEMTSFSMQTILIMIFLMFVGGASQSTAGGVKVNAFAVTVFNLWAVIRGSSRVEVFHRELSTDSIRRANATVIMYLAVFFTGLFILSIFEPQASLIALVFECVSAMSTVGSSLNLTPTLHTDSKILICFLMFIGRVGLITLVMGIIRQKKLTKYKYPSDNIIIN